MLALAIRGFISSSVSAGRRFVPAALLLGIQSAPADAWELRPRGLCAASLELPRDWGISGRHTLVLHNSQPSGLSVACPLGDTRRRRCGALVRGEGYVVVDSRIGGDSQGHRTRSKERGFSRRLFGGVLGSGRFGRGGLARGRLDVSDTECILLRLGSGHGRRSARPRDLRPGVLGDSKPRSLRSRSDAVLGGSIEDRQPGVL